MNAQCKEVNERKLRDALQPVSTTVRRHDTDGYGIHLTSFMVRYAGWGQGSCSVGGRGETPERANVR